MKVTPQIEQAHQWIKARYVSEHGHFSAWTEDVFAKYHHDANLLLQFIEQGSGAMTEGQRKERPCLSRTELTEIECEIFSIGYQMRNGCALASCQLHQPRDTVSNVCPCGCTPERWAKTLRRIADDLYSQS